MKKRQLTDTVSRITGQSTRSVEDTLAAIISVVSDALEAEDDVVISNFGKLYIKQRKPKTVYDFGANKSVVMQPTKAVVFEPAKQLKDRLNKVP